MKNRPSLVQFDVYSCKDFEPQRVFDHLDVMELTKIDYKFFDREQEFIKNTIKLLDFYSVS